MPKFNVSVPHALQRAVAVERLKGFSDEIQKKSPVELSDITEDWDHSGNLKFSFCAMGLEISGTLVASDADVRVEGKMPFAAAIFRGSIETQIAERIKQAIEL